MKEIILLYTVLYEMTCFLEMAVFYDSIVLSNDLHINGTYKHLNLYMTHYFIG